MPSLHNLNNQTKCINNCRNITLFISQHTCRITHKRHLEAWVEKYEILISINPIDLQDWQLQTIDVDISEAWNKMNEPPGSENHVTD